MSQRIHPETGKVRRGANNVQGRGSAENRRRRKQWLLETYAADRSLIQVEWWSGEGATTIEQYVITCESLIDYPTVLTAIEVPTCRCYRCGMLLHFDTLTVDRIVPGCKKTAEYPKGGTYARKNIRPACGGCNTDTGSVLGIARRAAKKKVEVQRIAGRVTVRKEDIETHQPNMIDVVRQDALDAYKAKRTQITEELLED